ncbi:helix-turn-helix domain-containing protein [Variovorax soli]|uniref:AcrR family transcriptional regulator n=1 Tax=Variovorax soli TaxID=376815 RepID=A0ABU1NDZ4_9BURK|nr:helix-turn-helix domain-containing protein [Variovorax soli]MDR6536280.1 AcrR family transcriptional regulator [Variovorax soli]
MSTPPSLLDRHADATQKLILSSSIELLERYGVSELTMRAVARHGGMSERTLFRYFASREQFLDAVAAEVTREIDAPAPPRSIDDLRTYPGALFSRFEEKAELVKAALHTELYDRLRLGIANERWAGVRRIVDEHAPHRTARDRKLAAANIRFYLSGSSWHYYRFHFGFTLKETIDSAQLAIRLALDDIGNGDAPGLRREAVLT